MTDDATPSDPLPLDDDARDALRARLGDVEPASAEVRRAHLAAALAAADEWADTTPAAPVTLDDRRRRRGTGRSTLVAAAAALVVVAGVGIGIGASQGRGEQDTAASGAPAAEQSTADSSAGATAERSAAPDEAGSVTDLGELPDDAALATAVGALAAGSPPPLAAGTDGGAAKSGDAGSDGPPTTPAPAPAPAEAASGTESQSSGAPTSSPPGDVSTCAVGDLERVIATATVAGRPVIVVVDSTTATVSVVDQSDCSRRPL